MIGYPGMHNSKLAVVLTPIVEPWRLVSPQNNNISEKTVLIKRFKTKVSIKTTSLISIVLR